MALKYLIDKTYSKRDLNGNVYWCAKITRVSDGATLEGIIDYESAPTHQLHKAGAIEFGQNETHETQSMMMIREFNRFTKGMKFIHQEQINEFVNGKAVQS